MRARRAAFVMAAVAAVGISTRSALADIIVNDFDNADSAAEVAQWTFAYGILATFTSSDATIAFSTDDANGGSGTSGPAGCAPVWQSSNASGDEGAGLGRSGLGALDSSAAGVLTLDADVKIVTGSAQDQFQQSGFFQLAHQQRAPRITFGWGFCGQRSLQRWMAAYLSAAGFAERCDPRVDHANV